MTSKYFPLSPTTANGIFLEGNEGDIEEIGGRTQNWENHGKPLGVSQVECHFAGFP